MKDSNLITCLWSVDRIQDAVCVHNGKTELVYSNLTCQTFVFALKKILYSNVNIFFCIYYYYYVYILKIFVVILCLKIIDDSIELTFIFYILDLNWTYI